MPWSKQIKDDRTSQNNTNSGHIPWKCIIISITFLPTLIGTTSLYWNIVYSLTTFMQRIDWLVNGQWEVCQLYSEQIYSYLKMETEMTEERGNGGKHFWLLLERYGETLVLCSGYTEPNLFRNIQERYVAFRYHILQQVYDYVRGCKWQLKILCLLFLLNEMNSRNNPRNRN